MIDALRVFIVSTQFAICIGFDSLSVHMQVLYKLSFLCNVFMPVGYVVNCGRSIDNCSVVWYRQGTTVSGIAFQGCSYSTPSCGRNVEKCGYFSHSIQDKMKTKKYLLFSCHFLLFLDILSFCILKTNSDWRKQIIVLPLFSLFCARRKHGSTTLVFAIEPIPSLCIFAILLYI